MAFSLSDNLWKLSALGASIIAGSVALSLTKRGWRKVSKEDPPKNPASSETTWPKALIWTAVSGLAIGLGRLLARRGMASLSSR